MPIQNKILTPAQIASFTASVATTLDGQSFTVHLDSSTGPLVATVMVPKTSGWYSWTPTTVLVAPTVNGT